VKGRVCVSVCARAKENKHTDRHNFCKKPHCRKWTHEIQLGHQATKETGRQLRERRARRRTKVVQRVLVAAVMHTVVIVELLSASVMVITDGSVRAVCNRCKERPLVLRAIERVRVQQRKEVARVARETIDECAWQRMRVVRWRRRTVEVAARVSLIMRKRNGRETR
jgi:hypothetical protein